MASITESGCFGDWQFKDSRLTHTVSENLVRPTNLWILSDIEDILVRPPSHSNCPVVSRRWQWRDSGRASGLSLEFTWLTEYAISNRHSVRTTCTICMYHKLVYFVRCYTEDQSTCSLSLGCVCTSDAPSSTSIDLWTTNIRKLWRRRYDPAVFVSTGRCGCWRSEMSRQYHLM
jgi:hypothetical protein